MFATGLIVFRETLEAALFIGIMAAATRGLAGRTRAIVLGVIVGLFGSMLVAGLINEISNAADGAGQDWLNVIVLGLAFVMLTWHVVWSNKHGREMAQEAKQLGAAAKIGKASMWAVSVAIAMIVLREGSETVLFVKGALANNDRTPVAVVQPVATESGAAPEVLDLTTPSGSLPNEVDLTKPKAAQTEALPTEVDLTKQTTKASDPALPTEVDLTKGAAAPMATASEQPATTINATDALIDSPVAATNNTQVALGGFGGLFFGILVGAALYFGLASIPVGKLFSLTNVFVVLLAAGMAGQMGNKLVQADVLPSGADPVWDSSFLVEQSSGVGTFFNALMGYEARPSLTHVAFFALGLLVIVAAERWAKARA